MYLAIIDARFVISLASLLPASFEKIVADFNALLWLSFEDPRNSLKTYAPRAAPSATALTPARSRAGRAKVAPLFPASALDALPAALRKTS